ncbi:MAG: F0F1 ATP synthase subunit A [Bacteroidales bacterium]
MSITGKRKSALFSFVVVLFWMTAFSLAGIESASGASDPQTEFPGDTTDLSLVVGDEIDDAEQSAPAFDARKVIIDHSLDAYGWHLADIGNKHFSIPLPVILFFEGQLYVFSSNRLNTGDGVYKGFRIAPEGPGKGRIVRVGEDGLIPDYHTSTIYDFSITKNVASVFIASLLICLLFISIGRQYKKREVYDTPKGLSAFFEPLIVFVRDQIAILAIGPDYHRFMPYLLSVFFFIFLSNLLGILPVFPGGANMTGNISVTFVLAMFTFFITHWYANRDYWKHMFNMPGVPLFLKFPVPILPVIEIAGVLIKPFVLMIRLFANITAGHMVLLSFTSLIFVLGSMSLVLGYAISPLSVIFLIFLYFLKILVAFLQAYIFTLFSAFFFGVAVSKTSH